ncbi:unnamed protein product [Ostreobium quekettii]|uniref:Uncharacterized protein n=1 Tax=Ostreobium quekettii TaxID=121088 RepID=A0A8S1J6C9_9CHLO|nr:unnamed protein product [Ostreobium quekettii]
MPERKCLAVDGLSQPSSTTAYFLPTYRDECCCPQDDHAFVLKIPLAKSGGICMVYCLLLPQVAALNMIFQGLTLHCDLTMRPLPLASGCAPHSMCFPSAAGEERCRDLIEAHKECLRGEGFKVSS